MRTQAVAHDPPSRHDLRDFGLRLSDHLSYLLLANPGGDEQPIDSGHVTLCERP